MLIIKKEITEEHFINLSELESFLLTEDKWKLALELIQQMKFETASLSYQMLKYEKFFELLNDLTPKLKVESESES